MRERGREENGWGAGKREDSLVGFNSARVGGAKTTASRTLSNGGGEKHEGEGLQMSFGRKGKRPEEP